MTTETTRRRFPYIWPTWISPLLAGDRQCWWAAWFRAHHEDYPKIEDRDESRLKLWKAEHGDLVARVKAGLTEDGWTVTVENQNKISAKGKIAYVGGCPDVVAERPDSDDARVVDAKTGRRKDADFWQVVTYIALLTLKPVDGKPGGRLHGKSVSGAVQYRDGRWEIGADVAAEAAPRVFEAIRTVGMELAPPHVPSEAECRACDIGCCPARVATVTPPVETEEF